MRARRSFGFALSLGLALGCGERPPLSELILPVPTRVLGRPLALARDERAGPARVEAQLRAAGYRPATAGKPVGRREFRLAPRRYEIGLGSASYPGAPPPNALAVALLDARERVQELTLDGKAAARVLLEPPLIATLAESGEDREIVRLERVPKHVVDAVLDTEDRRFFSHIGVDPIRSLGALVENARERRIAEGGSTITQQLAKNVYLSPARTLRRKLAEIVRALWLEARYAKREILEAYLNEIYLGQDGAHAIHGVARAARFYFGKDVKELTPAEGALLAALIRAPNALSPFRHPAAARERRDLVLDFMLEQGHLDARACASAKRSPLGVKREPEKPLFASHFVEGVRAGLASRVDEDAMSRAGFAILTTLDVVDQRAAEAAVREQLARLERDYPALRRPENPLQAALVALDPESGDVLAWVGGRSAARGGFDRARSAHRQPGSVFKPVVALAALARDVEREPFTLATILADEPFELEVEGEPWSPENYDGRYRGPVTVRRALEDSLNVPIARLALETGLVRVADTARALGVESPLRPIPSLALGAFEMTPIEVARVYSVLASGGILRAPRRLLGVREADGDLLAGDPTRAERVFSQAETYLVTSALLGAVERGTARSLRELGVRGPFAGKTGTTNDRRDAWFVAYTPELVVVVWVGFDDGAQVGLTGAQAAIPIAARFIRGALGAEGWDSFPVPERLTAVEIDPATGLLAASWCPGVPEVFLRGTRPIDLCPRRKPWWRWW